MYEKLIQEVELAKKGKQKVVFEESESESSDGEEQEEVIKKPTAAAPTPRPPRRGIDFSNCF